jgi:hypothetical protein
MSVQAMRRREADRRELRELKERAGRQSTRSTIFTAAVTLMIAVLTSLVTLVVAVLGGWVSISTTQLDADEERSREARQRVAAVYIDYLVAARQFHYVATQRNIALAEGKSEAEVEMLLPYKNWKAAASAYRKQVNMVQFFGSSEAWRLVQEIANLITLTGTERDSIESLAGAFENLEAVICKEASAKPRDDCGSIDRGTSRAANPW